MGAHLRDMTDAPLLRLLHWTSTVPGLLGFTGLWLHRVKYRRQWEVIAEPIGDVTRRLHLTELHEKVAMAVFDELIAWVVAERPLTEFRSAPSRPRGDRTVPRRWQEWPSQGRVGRARVGASDEYYVFVWPEIDGCWGLRTSSGIDEVRPGTRWLDQRIRTEGIEWIAVVEDGEIERRLFGLRPIYTSRFEDLSVFRRLRARFRQLGAQDVHTAIAAWEARIRPNPSPRADAPEG
ncbi:hypothetical protein [Nocardioides alcanivorans]|uniref:hypothetical protein n=1 Tax=Nocardioides alcanivorans TaxID=2897352 RepID=UPI001F1C8532|nr:hypothetical protein [Nocardioides alcanivorans]